MEQEEGRWEEAWCGWYRSVPPRSLSQLFIADTSMTKGAWRWSSILLHLIVHTLLARFPTGETGGWKLTSLFLSPLFLGQVEFSTVHYNVGSILKYYRYYCLAAAAAVMKYVEHVQHVTYAPHSLHIKLTSSENTLAIGETSTTIFFIPAGGKHERLRHNCICYWIYWLILMDTILVGRYNLCIDHIPWNENLS